MASATETHHVMLIKGSEAMSVYCSLRSYEDICSLGVFPGNIDISTEPQPLKPATISTPLLLKICKFQPFVLRDYNSTDHSGIRIDWTGVNYAVFAN